MSVDQCPGPRRCLVTIRPDHLGYIPAPNKVFQEKTLPASEQFRRFVNCPTIIIQWSCRWTIVSEHDRPLLAPCTVRACVQRQIGRAPANGLGFAFPHRLIPGVVEKSLSHQSFLKRPATTKQWIVSNVLSIVTVPHKLVKGFCFKSRGPRNAVYGSIWSLPCKFVHVWPYHPEVITSILG
jgi:hypothetical protein